MRAVYLHAVTLVRLKKAKNCQKHLYHNIAKLCVIDGKNRKITNKLVTV